jgi:hypothetical protein
MLCIDYPFLAVLSTLSSLGVLSQQSCSGSPVLAALCWQSCHAPILLVLSWQSRPACFVLSVLSCMSYSGCSNLLVLLCLSCSAFPGSAFPVLPVLFFLFCSGVLFWLPCPACPVLAVLFCFFCSGCSGIRIWDLRFAKKRDSHRNFSLRVSQKYGSQQGVSLFAKMSRREFRENPFLTFSRQPYVKAMPFTYDSENGLTTLPGLSLRHGKRVF